LVGCGNDRPFHLDYTAWDPDGSDHCEKVVFYSTDSTSSLGLVHVEKSCANPKGIDLILTNPEKNLRKDSAVIIPNNLFVEVWDDNDEVHRDIIRFPSRTNVLPHAEGGRYDPQPAYFTGAIVRFWIGGSDSDGAVSNMRINWDDGNLQDTVAHFAQSHTEQVILPHRYGKPGKYAPWLEVLDDCGDQVKYQFGNDTVRVRENSRPRIELDSSSHDPGNSQTFRVKMKIIDPDTEAGIDPLTVILAWSDLTKDTLPPVTLSNVTVIKKHTFPDAPVPSGFHSVIVDVTDSQGEEFQVGQIIPVYVP
ncbi:MAG: hypothetical protein ABI036_20420, partial [Fibrobacteria bacterium]